MSFAKIESEIIRDADMDGSLKTTPSGTYIDLIFDMAVDLKDSPSFCDVKETVGNIGKALILFCAKEDIDLTTCIRKAVEK